MKKIMLSMMAFAAIAFTSCGNKQASETAKEDSIKVEAAATEAVDETADVETRAANDVAQLEQAIESNQTNSVNIMVDAAKQSIQELLNAGKTEAASIYASKIKTTIDGASDKLQAAGVDVSGLNGVISGALGTATGTANAAVQTATGAVEGGKAAVENAKEAGKAAVENAKEAGKAAVENAKEAGKAAVENAKNAGKAAIQNAANAGAAALGDALNKALGTQQ